LAETFKRNRVLPVSAAEAFAWHERPGALERLMPPWENVTVQCRGEGICDGSVVEVTIRLGPVRLKWIAEHTDYDLGRSFCDTQTSGPFARWVHHHGFQPSGDGESLLADRVDYQLPGGSLGNILAGRFVRKKLGAMFAYRHDITQADLAVHAKHKKRGPMNIAVTGASGLVGSALLPMLTTGGHAVTRLVRREPGELEARWDPLSDGGDVSALEGVDAVVHLAGKNVASGRWTDKVKEQILSSRAEGTRNLCQSLAKMSTPPKVLVCASAIGFYGSRGDEVMIEESAPGTGFLAGVCQQWEDAASPARDAGIRVVNLRIGVILSPRGGALAKMLLPFKLGGGGRVGDGRQFWSWIAIDDVVGAIHHALVTDTLSGPLNTVAPGPVTNAEFTKTLGRVLRRPTIVPMPAFLARLALGEMADDLLLSSTRVDSERLGQSGYEFRQPALEGALRHLLGR